MTENIALLPHRVPSGEELQAFLERQIQLVALERSAEEEQTHLLNSKCSPRLLEQRGLAIGSLGLASISIGLGGKTLLELNRPLAYHTTTAFPSHTFRTGDPVRVDAHVTGNANGAKGKAKGKKDDDETGGVDGVVSRVFQDKIVVAVDEGKEVNLPERLRILKLANSVTFDRLERTLAHLKRLVLRGDANIEDRGDATGSKVSSPPPLPGLVEALLGLSTPTWTGEPHLALSNPTSDVQWFDPSLNESQKEAVRFCLTAGQVACIHGPPGTGKTHTLVELILQLLARPANSSTSLPPRILIATPSNLALDNLLLRLYAISKLPAVAPLLPPGAILRLGHPTRVHRDLLTQTLDWRASNGDDSEVVKGVKIELEGHMGDLTKKRGEKGAVKGKDRAVKWQEVRELRKEYRQREAKVVKNVVGAAQIVLATCHGAGSKQINNVQFDICIIDEATQAIEAACWIPALRSKKLILAGDPQQLPPTILGDTKKTRNGSLRKSAIAIVDSCTDPSAQKTPSNTAVKEIISHKQSIQDDGSGLDSGLSPDDGESSGGVEHVTSDLKNSRLGSETLSWLRPPRTLEHTLFERLERFYGPGIKRVLTTQYRMNSQIASFPSATLYDNALVSADSVKDRTLLSLPTIVDPDSEDSQDALAHPVVFFDTAGCEFYERSDADDAVGRSASLGDGSRSNANEAEVVVRWARQLITLGVEASDIGIVTPYQAQVSLLSASLHDDFPEMTIGSVDGLQGQEREAIILSLVRSNPTGEVGFLAEYRRLNVAMTRAKRQLCVVGDSETVGKGSDYLRKWMTWLESEADIRWAGESV